MNTELEEKLSQFPTLEEQAAYLKGRLDQLKKENQLVSQVEESLNI